MTTPWMSLKKKLLTLREDIYPQPMDGGHMRWTHRAICKMQPQLEGVQSVLDVGCGVGYAERCFKRIGITEYSGITLGEEDVETANLMGRNVREGDFHFLPWKNESFDMVFSRHSLEHSPMPLIALMEWHRVSKKYLGLVLPNPGYWGWGGRNHYSVMQDVQAEYLIVISGWEVIMKDTETPEEYIYLCKKQEDTIED